MELAKRENGTMTFHKCCTEYSSSLDPTQATGGGWNPRCQRLTDNDSLNRPGKLVTAIPLLIVTTIHVVMVEPG